MHMKRRPIFFKNKENKFVYLIENVVSCILLLLLLCLLLLLLLVSVKEFYIAYVRDLNLVCRVHLFLYII